MTHSRRRASTRAFLFSRNRAPNAVRVASTRQQLSTQRIEPLLRFTRWPQARTDAVLQALWGLEQTEDVGALLGRLTV